MRALEKPLFATQRKSHKIAFYIRVSTEEQAENPEGSIRNQEERLQDTVKLKNQIDGNFGEVVGIYKDIMSGKDANRPQLQKLLSAITSGKVDLIMVSELSRLSRNMRDFSEMWELMRSKGCGIMSLRENFDTTTAAGEMVLYTIANIAQFERRQTSERTSANFAARASRGLYNGGAIPLGYRLDPERKGYLIVNQEEAEIIRKAFEVFVKERAIANTAKWLNANGYRYKKEPPASGKKRVGHFTFCNLDRILRNKSYIGVRAYRVNGKLMQTKAVWEPIVSEEVFTGAHEILSRVYGYPKNDMVKKYPFILSGSLRCGECQEALVGKSSHGRHTRYQYYEHNWIGRKDGCLEKKTSTCKTYRVRAERTEEAIWKAALGLLREPKVQAELLTEAGRLYRSNQHAPEIERLKRKIESQGAQLELLAERLAELPKGVPTGPIYGQMEKIEAQRTANRSRLLELEGENDKLGDRVVHLEAYREFSNGLASLTETMIHHDQITCRKILRKLIRRIEVFEWGFRVYYFVGDRHFADLPQEGTETTTGKTFFEGGSNKLTNGVGDGN